MLDTQTSEDSGRDDYDCRLSGSMPGGPVHILMASARAFPFVGGIETHISEVSIRLAEAGHRITLLTTDPTGRLPREETRSGVQIVRVGAWPSRSDFYLAPAIFQKVLRSDFDVLHIQGYHTFVAPLAMLAAIRKRAPFVITFHSGGHSSAFRKLLRGPQSAILAPLVRAAAAHISVSEFEAAAFSKSMGLSPNKAFIVSNGGQLPAVPAAVSRPATGPLLLSIGRLERYKGHHKAIEAMHKLQWRFPNAQLRILGAGPYEAKLRELINKLRLSSKVKIQCIRSEDRTALSGLLSIADLVLLFSEYEAHPVSIIEALSLGRKVLTSHTSGFIELEKKGLIRTVPLTSSPIEIAEAMVEAFNAPEPVAKVVMPTWDACALKLEAIYRRVLDAAVVRS
jgi:glycosyltransferase involved in cell wall biosynthesis